MIGARKLRPALAALALGTIAAASAQQDAADPVVEHFRDYRAALERQDLAAAESAAAAALAASEAVNGPRTGVLALNLANVRLELDGEHDALSPARTAHALAASSAAGVDPATAALTLGRAEIAAGDSAGAARLLETLADVEGNAELEADAYTAAIELGAWAIGAKDYATARQAWSTAAGLAHTTPDPEIARARALTGEGAAIFLASSDTSLPQPAETNGVPSPRDAKIASDALATAQRLLAPAAYTDVASDSGLTARQLAYAEAMAWQSALFAKLEHRRLALPSNPTFGSDVPPFDVNAQCKMRSVRDSGQLSYPREVLARFGVGSVVVHFALDSKGAVTSRSIAAAIPSSALAQAVEAAAAGWKIERDSTSARNCRIPSSAYVNVRFVLG